MPEIDCRVDRAVAVISIANPPVNSLSHGVRAGVSLGGTLLHAWPLPGMGCVHEVNPCFGGFHAHRTFPT